MTYKRCAVIDCSNDENSCNISFHGFPTKSIHSSAWHQFLDTANENYEWKPTKYMTICSAHFDMKCYGMGGNRLLKNSVPTLVNQKRLVPSIPKVAVMNAKQETKTILFLSDSHAWSTIVSEYANRLSEHEDEIIKLKQKNLKLEHLCGEKEKVIHVLSQRARREEKRKRDITLESNVPLCKRKKLMKTAASQTQVMELPSASPLQKFLKELSDRIIHPNAPYSDFLKTFSFTLHFKSPAAYEFLRDSCDKALPHFCNFNRWTKHVDSKTGFLKPSLEYIRNRVEESQFEVYYALLFDEVYIRKEILHDGEGYVGFVDYGGLAPEEDPSDTATKALFFNLTEINGRKRIPVAYALTNKLRKESLAKMITKILIKLEEVGARVLTITCDGLPTNLAALESLGANILKPELPNFQPWFSHPTSGKKIYIILDVCHMYKLIRNFWKNTRNFYIDKEDNDKDDEKPEKVASWDFIERLQNLQKTCGLRAANKLTERHTGFEKTKMKTAYCLQTISNSVSISVGVCRELGIENFEGSEATEEFLSIMNRLFDALNSRPFGKGAKAPLKQSNFDYFLPFFQQSKSYLLKLMCYEKGKKKRIIDSRKSTAIKGLIITISSFEMIMREIVLNPEEDLAYMPTYRSSQDPIELFFSLLRSRFGNNDNPNVLQLRYAVRDILCMKMKDCVTGNCLAQEDGSTVISPLGNLQRIVNDEYGSASDINFEEIVIPGLDNLPRDSEVFIRTIVAYIADIDIDEHYLLIQRRDFGGLCYPSRSVIIICGVVESHVRFWSDKGLAHMKKSKIIETSIHECKENRVLLSLKCDSELHEAGAEQTEELARGIMSNYLTARLHYLAKQATLKLNPSTNRSFNKKLTHFAGN